MNFEELNIIPPILKALGEEQYEKPSPIQEKAIPPALQGRDVLGCAQTGTGKTAAFAVPILQRLNMQPPVPKGQRREIRSLILTPTRELAIQIGDSLHAYGRYLGLRSEVIFGGVSQVSQVKNLKNGIDVLVATPGRLNDLIQQGFVDLGKIETFVLDEADRMLDMGFIHDVKRIIARLPEKKQTLFFSATMPAEITKLVDSLLVDPIKVAVTPVSSTVEAIQQSVYFVDKSNKPKLLIDLLKNSEIESALVFTRTKHGADRVVRELARVKIKAQAIHGNKSQTARQFALNSFKAHNIRVLVATDIAARGIDIDELSHVINYDLPDVPETYVHRIGRTGRAGLDGMAISFCNIDEKSNLKDIEKLIGKEVPVVEDHPYPMQVFTLTPPKQHMGRMPKQQSERRPKANAPKKDAIQSKQTAPKKDVKKSVPKSEAKPKEKKAEPMMQEKPRQSKPKQRQPERTEKKPEKEGRKAPAAPRKEEYVSTLAARKKSEPPRPLLQSAQTGKKPADQFLSNKPFFRKG
ncbi:DEAD/DEAH box helicase [Clostridium minihomine]|uniref:DEAD/DEAH box helicase n=1 Tax=Clostridium minihomine TaxID=2045012 RepID=UPI000C783DCB|nr:DEAD/DEAH box helicase [Clostridium minihomine]